MTEQERLSKQLQYKKLGFTRFESAIPDSELSQIEEALKDVKLHEAQDYSLPRKTLGEIRSATRGLKKKIFDGVGLQVDYFPLEIPMPNAP